MKLARHAFVALATIALAAAAWPAAADDPIPEIEDVINAPLSTITIYPIATARFPDFLNAAVSAGPFNAQYPGFANERILEPPASLPGEIGNAVIVSRFYDAATAEKVNAGRDDALKEFAQGTPVRYTGKLISTTFGNWNWEVGDKQPFAQKSFTLADMDAAMAPTSNVSVSFGKSGYVGQVAMVEFFPGTTPLQAIREAFARREALSGASIYEAEGGGAYIVYSEYFQGPQAAANSTFKFALAEEDKRPAVTGSQLGIVASNYGNR